MNKKIKKEYMFLGGLMLLGFVIVGIYIFNKSYALDETGSIDLDCDKEVAGSGDEIVCSVIGNVSSYQVSALESQVSLSENLEFVSFTVDSTSEDEDDRWQGNGDDGNIQLYIANNKSDEFTIGELKVKVKENSVVDEEDITLKDVVFYNENFEEREIASITANIKGSSDTNEDYLTINNLDVLEDEKIIYNLDVNKTYSEILKNIDTNGNIKILDKDNKELSDSNVLKTGDTIKIEFSSKNVEYKISVLGDINGDGEIDGFDVAPLYSYAIGVKVNISREGILAGDIQNDNEIDGFDVAPLYSYAIGANSSLRK